MRRQSFFLCMGILLSAGFAWSSTATAAVLEVPIALDYRILEEGLKQQVFTGPLTTAEVFSDEQHCNSLVLSDPRVSGADSGQIRVLVSATSTNGTFLGGQCLIAQKWEGLIETFQVPHTDAASATVTFEIVDTTILSKEGKPEPIPELLELWINQNVQSHLDAVSLDLLPALEGVQEVLDSTIDPSVLKGGDAGAAVGSTLSNLRLVEVRPTADALVAELAVDVPDAPPDWQLPAQSVLSDEELAQWDADWQAWDAFATWMIKTMAISASPEVVEALADTLLEARYELRDALARDDRNRDQVRDLFLSTWERLAPIAGQIQLGLPGAQAMQYAGFVSSGEALKAMDLLAPHLGIRIDSNSLRALARMLVPAVTDYDLRYDMSVDPELRALLGLPPQFADEEPPDEVTPIVVANRASILDWFISSARAATIDPELVARLDSWVPKRREIDDYLAAVEKLLDSIVVAERARGKVPPTYFELHENLLRATAFTESCWRQFVERKGTVQPITSYSGSVGLMQVNANVWRGVYEIGPLQSNIGYNARAGNEILVHYLVDYAIRKKEHELSDDPDSLARATYAVYNGGPKHLTRYRNPKTSESLKHIDDTFLKKYHSIQDEGQAAVKECLAG